MVRYFPDDLTADDPLPRILSRDDALKLGFSRRAVEHRLATGRWQLVLPHTYLTSNVMTWPDRQRAALAYAGPGAVLTGAAALADEGLRSVTRPDLVLVLAPRSATASDRQWVRVRRTARLPEPALLAGPARAPFARAVADLALERRRLDDVRTLVAQAVRGRLCTVDELITELIDGPRRGSRNLRQAIDEIGSGSWSAPEARAATILRGANVPPFEQNARIDLPNGRWLIADFLWRELRAILEIDSMEHHHSNPVQIEATHARHLELESLGYSVTHRTPWLVANRSATFRSGIERWLAARAREILAR
jgi:hypothetical protein